jgi:hypothetical protein
MLIARSAAQVDLRSLPLSHYLPLRRRLRSRYYY